MNDVYGGGGVCACRMTIEMISGEMVTYLCVIVAPAHPLALKKKILGRFHPVGNESCFIISTSSFILLR